MSLSAAQISIVKSTAPILKVHGKTITTTFYRNMLAAHPELKNYFSLRNQQTGAQQAALANSVLAYAQYIDDLPKLHHAVERIAHKHASLFIKADHYPIVGKYLIGAIGEVLGDALTTDIKDAWVAAYGQLADVFINREKQLYAENGDWQSWRKFKIIKKEAENEGVTSFYLEPTDGVRLPKFLPGQYVSLQVPVPELDGLLQSRQFSLSEAPESGANHFRVSVKKELTVDNAPVEDLAAGKVPGLISNMLHNEYNVGDVVELSPPQGEFYVDPANTAAIGKPLVLVSAGVGAAPLLSIHDAVLASETASRPITWIHAARHSGTSCYAKHVRETAKIRENVTAKIFLEEVHDGDKLGEAYDFTGRVSLEKLEDEKLLHLGDKTAEYYVCGPEEWMVDVRAWLETRGVERERQHLELFKTGDVE
ncbi:Fc.00g031570.m01.CDS01 [Cosmosporella sp. VM-42]